MTKNDNNQPEAIIQQDAAADGAPATPLPATGGADAKLPDTPAPDDAVGYGKPPKGSRFKKGAPSANPAGRPRIIKGSVTTTKRGLNSAIAITENGKKHNVTVLEAIIKRQISDALNGDPKARAEILAFANKHMPKDRRVARRPKAEPWEWPETDDPRLARFREMFERQSREDEDEDE